MHSLTDEEFDCIRTTLQEVIQTVSAIAWQLQSLTDQAQERREQEKDRETA